MAPGATVLLGSIAIEPNRWATIHADHRATVDLASWMDLIADAGFDGVELWEKHLTQATPDRVQALLDHRLPLTIFNSYVSFDDVDDTSREETASWVARARSTGVKFNVGNEPGQQRAYAERLVRWLNALPSATRALCECHHGISIAEDPMVAAAIFDAAGGPERVQAIVHTHEDPDALRVRFDAYGDRISHVHVNQLDFQELGAPPLADIRGELETKVSLLADLGFEGTWTIEFTHGLLTEADHPAALLEQAAADLVVLREVLE